MIELNKLSTVVAYQYLRLIELEEESLSYTYYLKKVKSSLDEVEKNLDSLKRETESLDKFLFEEFGIDIRNLEDSKEFSKTTVLKRRVLNRKYQVRAFSFDELYEKAAEYLRQVNINPNKDPLVQVLPIDFIKEVLKEYNEKFVEISWSKADYIVIGLASVIAVILDIFLVRTPEKTVVNVLGKKFNVEGSPLTRWIKEKSRVFHETFGVKLEKIVQVPYDGATSNKSNGALVYADRIEGLNPRLHRLMSIGHDPVMGIIFGVLDIIQSKATFFDKYGNLIRTTPFPLNSEQYQVSLIEAFIKFILHLLSDIGTEKGIPAPLFSLIQGVKMKSPFALKENGEKVSWTNVARYMYTHGYDFRNFLSMGIVPMTVEIIIRGYWLLSNFGEDEALLKLKSSKLSSMRLLAHSLVASGNLIKTGIIYQMNPLALNYSELFFLTYSFVVWIRDLIRRNEEIKQILLNSWEKLYEDSIKFNYPI